MNVLITLGQLAIVGIIVLFLFAIMGVLVEVQNNLILKNTEKRRAIMLDLIEEEIITLNKTHAGKFGASEVVVEVNRRMNVKRFTNTDLLHMAETTIKSLKLKGVL